MFACLLCIDTTHYSWHVTLAQWLIDTLLNYSQGGVKRQICSLFAIAIHPYKCSCKQSFIIVLRTFYLQMTCYKFLIKNVQTVLENCLTFFFLKHQTFNDRRNEVIMIQKIMTKKILENLITTEVYFRQLPLQWSASWGVEEMRSFASQTSR